jgi:type I restriction enzyme S subunit
MIGTIGNPVVISEEPNFAIKNVALIKSNLQNSSYFYQYYLNSALVLKKMQNESKGATQKFVSLGYMRDFLVPNPDLETQQKIVAQLDQLSEQTNLLQEKYRQKLGNLEELKKSILERAFKGELV